MKSKKEPTKPDAPTAQLPQSFLDNAETLEEIIQWWKSRESNLMEAIERRPAFIEKVRNTGIRITEVILDRAVTKANRRSSKRA